jgi:hypothetical protein
MIKAARDGFAWHDRWYFDEDEGAPLEPGEYLLSDLPKTMQDKHREIMARFCPPNVRDKLAPDPVVIVRRHREMVMADICYRPKEEA